MHMQSLWIGSAFLGGYLSHSTCFSVGHVMQWFYNVCAEVFLTRLEEFTLFTPTAVGMDKRPHANNSLYV